MAEGEWVAFNPGGQTSHGWSAPWGSGHSSLSTLASPFSHTSPPSGLTLGPTWFHCLGFLLILLPGSPFGTAGGTMVIPQGICVSVLLLPLTLPVFVLRPVFYSLEEGGTNMCNMVLHPIVRNLGPSVWAHCITQEVWGVQVVESPTPKGLHNLCPEVHHCWC